MRDFLRAIITAMVLGTALSVAALGVGKELPVCDVETDRDPSMPARSRSTGCPHNERSAEYMFVSRRRYVTHVGIGLSSGERVRLWLLALLLLFGIAAQVTATGLSPDARVAAFSARTCEWVTTQLSQVKAGGELTFDGKLYRTAASGKIEPVPEIDTRKLADADRSYDKANHRKPSAGDVVQVLDRGMRIVRHAALETVEPGTRICFLGRAYDLRAGGTPSGVVLIDTGIVSSRVLSTSQNTTDAVVDLKVRSAGGVESTITGTTEHPFYVPAAHDYVAMGKLTPGTVLKTASGSTVSVVGGKQRHGAFTVHNFVVEGRHNYYVSAQGVLVHNGCPPPNLSPAGAGRRGAFRAIKRAMGIPMSQHPDSVGPAFDRSGVRIPGRHYYFGDKLIKEHFEYIYPREPIHNRGPHFNDMDNGHYDY